MNGSDVFFRELMSKNLLLILRSAGFKHIESRDILHIMTDMYIKILEHNINSLKNDDIIRALELSTSNDIDSLNEYIKNNVVFNINYNNLLGNDANNKFTDYITQYFSELANKENVDLSDSILSPYIHDTKLLKHRNEYILENDGNEYYNPSFDISKLNNIRNRKKATLSFEVKCESNDSIPAEHVQNGNDFIDILQDINIPDINNTPDADIDGQDIVDIDLNWLDTK